MPRYYVVTPPYERYPLEWGCDVEEVEAPNKAKAKGLALRKLRTYGYVRDSLCDNRSPFTGLEVHEA